MISPALAALSASALVGVARKPPAWPSAPGGLGEVIAGIPADDAESRLLRTAGVLSLADEAGHEPFMLTGADMPAAPPEELPAADSPGVEALCQQLLLTGPPEILGEMISLLHCRQLRFPPRHLPALLNAAAGKPVVRKMLPLLPGRRHLWLAGLNRAWSRIREETAAPVQPDERLWTEGSQAERLAVLRAVRAADPGRAREMAAAVFSAEPARERQEFLAVLGDQISADDIPFLERSLADKSKGVRTLAAGLLSRLPGSAFAQRITARLGAWLGLNRNVLSKASMEVSVPEAFDPQWAKDAIEEKPAQGEGAKAFWLRQTAGLAPLAWWEECFGFPPEDIISVCAASDWGVPLLQGLSAAVCTQRNAVWAAAFFRADIRNIVLPDEDALAAAAGPGAMEGILTSRLKHQPFSRVLAAAVNLEAWSLPFAEAMIGGIRAAALKEPDYTLYTALMRAALFIPPPALAHAAAGWETQPGQSWLSNALETFLGHLQLRLTLHTELSPPTP